MTTKIQPKEFERIKRQYKSDKAMKLAVEIAQEFWDIRLEIYERLDSVENKIRRLKKLLEVK